MSTQVVRVPCTTVHPEIRRHSADGRVEVLTHVACEGRLVMCPICHHQRYCTREHVCLDAQTIGSGHAVRRFFDIEDCYREYHGQPLKGWTKGEHWNGWPCPRFELPEAQVIADCNNSAKGEWTFTFDEAEQTFSLHDATYEGEPDEVFRPETLDTPEGPKTVYALGAWAWCWDDVTDEVPQVGQ